MEQNSSFLKSAIQEALTKRCKFHPNFPCVFLYLDPTTTHHRICQKCVEHNNIPQTQILNISSFLQSPSGILPPSCSNYPVFSDNDSTLKRIQEIADSLEETIQSVKYFYEDLLAEMKEAINKSMEEIKRNLNSLVVSHERIMQCFNKTTQIMELKNILISLGNDNDLDAKLSNFMQSWISQKRNADEINAICKDYVTMSATFSLANPENIRENILSLFKQIDFFAPSKNTELCTTSPPSLNSLESSSFLGLFSPPKQTLTDLSLSLSKNYYYSISNTIFQREPSGTFLISHKGVFDDCFAQCYFRNQLANNQKYIIRVQLIQTSLNKHPDFMFGLMPKGTQDDGYVGNQGMMYHEAVGCQVSRIIKGNYLHGYRHIGDSKILEFHIHIKDKLLRVADYPEFQNILELDDPQRIDERKYYYFAICLLHSQDSIRIIQAQTVEEFEIKQ